MATSAPSQPGRWVSMAGNATGGRPPRPCPGLRRLGAGLLAGSGQADARERDPDLAERLDRDKEAEEDQGDADQLARLEDLGRAVLHAEGPSRHEQRPAGGEDRRPN